MILAFLFIWRKLFYKSFSHSPFKNLYLPKFHFGGGKITD